MTLWFLARSTGLVALIAFTVSTALGAVSARPGSQISVPQLDRRFLTQMAHRSAAIVGLMMLATHVALIVLDTFADVSITGALIPFTAGYAPIALGAGTLAVYAIAATAISGALRGRLAISVASTRRWRYVHFSAYAGWGLAMGHGIFAGTDTGAWWTTAIYLACGTIVLAAITARIAAEAAHRSRPLAAARTFVRSHP